MVAGSTEVPPGEQEAEHHWGAMNKATEKHAEVSGANLHHHSSELTLIFDKTQKEKVNEFCIGVERLVVGFFVIFVLHPSVDLIGHV